MRDLNPIRVEKIFEDLVLNNSSKDSVRFDLRKTANLGYHALAYHIKDASHADARVDFHFLLSPTGEYSATAADSSFSRSADGHEIVTDCYEESGVDSAGASFGKGIVTFNPTLAHYMFIQAIETATQNATIDAWYISQ